MPKISGRTGRIPFFGTDLPRSCQATDIIPRIFAIFYCLITIAARYFSPSASIRAMGSRHHRCTQKSGGNRSTIAPHPPLLSGAPPQPGHPVQDPDKAENLTEPYKSLSPASPRTPHVIPLAFSAPQPKNKRSMFCFWLTSLSSLPLLTHFARHPTLDVKAFTEPSPTGPTFSASKKRQEPEHHRPGSHHFLSGAPPQPKQKNQSYRNDKNSF